MSKDKNIESIYPLSPMQSGMLFHTLYEPDSGVYFEQIIFRLQGNINRTAFQDAWQKVVDRHAVLRTLFVWEKNQKAASGCSETGRIAVVEPGLERSNS